VILDLWSSVGLEPPWKKHARPDGGYVPPPEYASRFHFEMKNQERLNIWGALDQAKADAPAGKAPVVVFSRSRAPLYIAMPYEAWKRLTTGENRHDEEEDSNKSSS